MSDHNTDRAQIAALGAVSIIEKINIAPADDLVSRQAAIVFLREALFSAGCVSDQVDAGLRVIEALPAQAQPADHVGDATEMVAPAVKVKPLAWEVTDWSSGDGVKGENDCGWAAGTTLNSWGYSIDWLGDEFEVDLDGKEKSRHPTLDAAKAAAQADYEARILAALEGGAA